jgi:uncharacterized membrane protein YhaH (DUF805 family)
MAKRNKFLIDGLFGFDGRFRRSEYWIATIGISIVRFIALVVGAAMLGKGVVEAGNFLPMRIGLDVAFLWPYTAIQIKRGHDRNRSAFYSGVLLALLYGLSWVILAFGPALNLVLTLVVGLGLMAISLYMLVEYGFIDGTKGPNRYGTSDKYPETTGERLVLGEPTLSSEPPKA